jgi:hypothetical protein
MLNYNKSLLKAGFLSRKGEARVSPPALLFTTVYLINRRRSLPRFGTKYLRRKNINLICSKPFPSLRKSQAKMQKV